MFSTWQHFRKKNMETIILNHKTCPECGEDFSTILNLEMHFLTEHEEEDIRIKQKKSLTPKKSIFKCVKYYCNPCDQEYTHENKYISHIKDKHVGVDYVCNQCDFKTSCDSNLRNYTQSRQC